MSILIVAVSLFVLIAIVTLIVHAVANSLFNSCSFNVFSTVDDDFEVHP